MVRLSLSVYLNIARCLGLGTSQLTRTEILDFGYPQNSEIDTLKMYITTESIKSEMAVVRPLPVTCYPMMNGSAWDER